MNNSETIIKIMRSIGIRINDGQEDINIFDAGLVDSLQIMQLLAELENTFNIEFDVDEIDPDTFETVNKISDIVMKKSKE